MNKVENRLHLEEIRVCFKNMFNSDTISKNIIEVYIFIFATLKDNKIIFRPFTRIPQMRD